MRAPSRAAWIAALSLLWTEAAAADLVRPAPFTCCDGKFATETIDGQPVWQILPGNYHLYFDVPSSFAFTPGSPVYVEVVYHDASQGTIWVQYDSTRGDAVPDIYARSEVHTRSSRVDGRGFVSSYHALEKPRFAGRQNGGADFRIAHTSGRETPLSVRSVTVRSSPFEDAGFQEALSKPWLTPYRGPTRDDVDATTLAHKVMAGYQGWYRAPNDLADMGWFHWCRDGVMVPENFNVDQWPDLSCFGAEEVFPAGGVLTRGGRPAAVFSSTGRETVLRHFRWMRKYGIDGAFLQRFAVKGNGGAYGQEEWVLARVREAANREGRIWAIEYDVSWVGDADALDVLSADWKWLVDEFHLLEDPRYAREGGKPVVAIWGLPFEKAAISKATADAVVDFFHHDPVHGGNHVLGGIPFWWRTMTGWYDHVQRYDSVLAWMPADAAAYRADRELLRSWGIEYVPHAWPGFSWANEMRISGTSDLVPRQAGAFFWRKIGEALASGAGRLFIGMFDECDEGTAIMPMSDDPPDPPPGWGRFITNEGRPADWWMLLAGQAREMLLGRRPTGPIPTEAELANRSNVGPEVTAVPVGEAGAGGCLSFAAGGSLGGPWTAGMDATIEVEYDDTGGEIGLEYDGVGGAYTPHPKGIAATGSGERRTARFEVADARFGGRQEGGADLRLCPVRGEGVPVRRVRVSLEERDCSRRLAGDVNGDGGLDISDPVWVLGHLFLGANPALPCEGGTAGNPGPGDRALVDFNGDGRIDLSDPVSILGFLFQGGKPPALGPGCVLIPGCGDACR